MGSTEETETKEPDGTGTEIAKAITQADLDAAVAAATRSARDAAYADARRTFESAATRSKAAPRKTETTTPDPGEIIARNMELLDALAEHSLNSKQRRRVLDAFRSANPEDPTQWASEFLADLGLTKSETETKNQTQTKEAATGESKAAVTQTQTKPIPAPGSAVSGIDTANVMKWDRAMVDAYIREKGAVPGDPSHPRNRPVLAELRRMFESKAAEIKIK